MSRNHEKLHVFHQSHKLTRAIYQHTRDFPRDEWFGLRAQMRRAAVSVPSNLVEGNARSGALASELGYVSGKEWAEIMKQSDVVVRRLQRLVQEMERRVAEGASGEADKARTRTGK